MLSFLEAREGNSGRAICTQTDHHSLDLQGSHCALEFLREEAVQVRDWLACLGAFSFPPSCLKAISGSSAFDWYVVLHITVVCTVFPRTLGDFHRRTFKGWCEGGTQNSSGPSGSLCPVLYSGVPHKPQWGGGAPSVLVVVWQSYLYLSCILKFSHSYITGLQFRFIHFEMRFLIIQAGLLVSM